MRIGYGLDSFVDYQGTACETNNVLQTARHFYEKHANGRYYRDRLSFPDANTGLPTQLPTNVYAETVFACAEPGDYVVVWDGGADVNVVLLGPSSDPEDTHAIGPVLDDTLVGGSNIAEAMQAVGLDDAASGEVAFTVPAGVVQVILRITRVTVGDAIRNLRCTKVERRSQWQDWSPEFQQRLISSRPVAGRVLDMMGPNEPPYRTCPVAWTDRRPDGYYTQSDVWLDVQTLSVGSWSGAAPSNGAGLAIERFQSGNWQQIGSGDVVRVGSPTGAWGHIKHSGGLGVTGDRVRDVTTGATATLTGDMARWEDRVMGLSCQMARDIAQVFRSVGASLFVIPFPCEMSEDAHRNWARAFRDDGRFTGMLICPELGNETWNPSLGGYARTYNYCIAQGVAAGMPQYPASPWYAGAQWYAWQQHNLHEWWKAEFGARAAEIPRFFFGQLRGGTHWADWRTGINPDNVSGFPSWPPQQFPIDAFFVNLYVAHTDEAPYNTVAWQRAATLQDWFDYVEAQIGVDTPIMQTLVAWANTRGGAKLCAYEGQFHFVPASSDQQAFDSMAAFHRSHLGGLALDHWLDQCSAAGVDYFIAYNWTRPWGRATGCWGVIESYTNPAATNRLYRVFRLRGADYEIVYDDATAAAIGETVLLELVGNPPVIFDLPVLGGVSTRAAGLVGLVQIPPIYEEWDFSGTAATSQRKVPATVDMDHVGDFEALLTALPAFRRVGCPPIDLVQLPPIADENNLDAEEATQTNGAGIADMDYVGVQDLEVLGAAQRPTVGTVAIEPVEPDDLGGDNWPGQRQWMPRRIGTLLKGPVDIRRASLLCELGADVAGDIRVVPLIGGLPFAGVAMEFADAFRDSMLVSRSGSFVLDLESPATPGDSVEVVAIDDQRVYTRAAADDLGLRYTVIGTGIVLHDRIVICDYAHERLRPPT